MREKLNNTAIAIAATIAGFCNALLGAGGGILLSFALGFFGNRKFEDNRSILINSQAAMIPGCLLSCILYVADGSFSLGGAFPFALAATIGGTLGAILLPHISRGNIGKIFALFVVWSGFRMIFG